MDQKQKKKQGPPGKDEKLDLKDLSGQVPPVSDVLSNLDEAVKQEVAKPKKQKGDCCLDLLRDCCMDD